MSLLFVNKCLAENLFSSKKTKIPNSILSIQYIFAIFSLKLQIDSKRIYIYIISYKFVVRLWSQVTPSKSRLLLITEYKKCFHYFTYPLYHFIFSYCYFCCFTITFYLFSFIFFFKCTFNDFSFSFKEWF